MNLVDEEKVSLLEPRHDARQVALLLNRRTARHMQRDTHLGGQNRRERGLAQTRRATHQHMVERLSAKLRSLNRRPQPLLHLLLPHIFVEDLRPQRRVVLLFIGNGTRGCLAVRLHGLLGRVRLLLNNCSAAEQPQCLAQQHLYRHALVCATLQLDGCVIRLLPREAQIQQPQHQVRHDAR